MSFADHQDFVREPTDARRDPVYDALTTERLRLLAEDRQDRYTALRRELVVLEQEMRQIHLHTGKIRWADRLRDLLNRYPEMKP